MNVLLNCEYRSKRLTNTIHGARMIARILALRKHSSSSRYVNRDDCVNNRNDNETCFFNVNNCVYIHPAMDYKGTRRWSNPSKVFRSLFGLKLTTFETHVNATKST